MDFKKAFLWTGFWILIALIFNAGVYMFMGRQPALDFLTGYVIELSLSMDNVFVFLMIFSFFGISYHYQKRALTYGIIGAVIMRLIFILLGVSVVKRFEWILYIFGAVLIVTAIKIFVGKEESVHPENNKIVKLFTRFFPVTNSLQGEKFFTRINGVLHATPLFIVVLVIESSDLLFAIDSIPAVFSVTKDPFIIYTSNIMAIMGLRSLYFFIERVQRAFVFLKQGVGVILFVTGLKMLLLYFHIEIPTLWALGIILGVLVISVVASIIFGKRRANMRQY